MGAIKLILLYTSPYSERVRWAFTFKGVPYEKKDYQPGVDEEEVKKLTGQAQVPVLLSNGAVVPDSTAILNWLEHYKPEPALMPTADKDRAQIILWGRADRGRINPASTDACRWALSSGGTARIATAGKLLWTQIPTLPKS